MSFLTQRTHVTQDGNDEQRDSSNDFARPWMLVPRGCPCVQPADALLVTTLLAPLRYSLHQNQPQMEPIETSVA